jgi:hypothetical protein
MAQRVECLCSKSKALNSNPSTTKSMSPTHTQQVLPRHSITLPIVYRHQLEFSIRRFGKQNPEMLRAKWLSLGFIKNLIFLQMLLTSLFGFSFAWASLQ